MMANKNTLESIAQDCASYNWDGNGAVPVTDVVIENARKVSQYFKIPAESREVFAIPNGHVQYETIDHDNYEEYEVSEDSVYVLVMDHGVVSFERTYTINDFIEAYRGPVWVPM